jgi:hypothetical protein
MSDTPRTDQMEQHAYWFDDDMTPVCESRFVRPLEMELIAAQQRIKRLEDIISRANRRFFRNGSNGMVVARGMLAILEEVRKP